MAQEDLQYLYTGSVKVQNFRVETASTFDRTTTKTTTGSTTTTTRTRPKPGLPCEVDAWSPWSGCTGICGWGLQFHWRARARDTFYPPDCWEQPLHETRPCAARVGCAPREFGEWTEWSACSATCGAGVRLRRRPRLSGASGLGWRDPGFALQEKESCSAFAPCERSCDAQAVRYGLSLVEGVSLERSLERCRAPLASGATCEVACNDGGHAERPVMCVSGSIFGPVRCAELTCRRPPLVPNGAAELLSFCSGYGVGSRCHVRCQAGFMPNRPFVVFRGNRLSNRSCLTHVFLKSGE